MVANTGVVQEQEKFAYPVTMAELHGDEGGPIEKKKAKNREAVMKHRLKKQTYLNKLELKVIQLNKDIQLKNEQLHQVANQQDINRDPINFNKQYNDWFVEHHQRILHLRRRLIGEFVEDDILPIVENILSQFYTIFNIKKNAAKVDVFSILYGTWMSPAHLSTMWVGGFRPTDMLKLISNHIEIYGPQIEKMKFLNSDIMNEEIALTTKFTNLEANISNTLTGKEFVNKGDEAAMSSYANSMSSLVGKFTIMHNFLNEADELRQKTISGMHEVLTTRQRVTALFAIHDHLKRLSTLSNMLLSTTTI
ncbi:TGACG-sequence-specific DNA-binding protein TGA-2.1-like [Rutidosis leptorrhynchoides]|uniref:TGACG-sequence-specific DNA-binding protein TGA-2.1-like n=1 Tax=Rutidosis leptorrhynchoides TaxID=125765 RepID=UPI003A9A5A67